MIHYFNPGHELAVQNASPYYMARASMLAMQRDLAFLLAWYASPADVVLVEEKDDTVFYTSLAENLQALPKPILASELKLLKETKVSLWGISQQGIQFIEGLNKKYAAHLIPPLWNEAYTYLNSRQSGRDCLVELIKRLPIISSLLVPQFYTDLSVLEKEVEASPVLLLAKAPYSSAGKGLLWLPLGGITRTERQRLQGMLNKQGSVSIEQVWDKQLDFAMEFMADGNNGVSFVGYSLFYTNAKGAYKGNKIASQEVIIRIISNYIDIALLETVKKELKSILADKYASVYTGCIGVDMLVYRQTEGTHALHPCVEINMRYNMGLLACNIGQYHICNTSNGYFSVDFKPEEGEVLRCHQAMIKLHPATFCDGRLQSGYLSLCPVAATSHYWAYILLE